MKTLCLLGCAWTQISVVFDVAYETLGVRNFQFLKNIPVEGRPDMNININFYKYVIHEPEEWVSLKDKHLFFGVNGPKAKLAVYSFFKAKYGIDYDNFINVIHPTSYLATSTQLQKGIFIEPKVIISSQTKIGYGVTLKRGVNIGHNSEIGDYSEINPGVTIPGHTKIGRGCIIGVGAVLKNQITIGDNTFIGMGSVVTKDIPSGVIAYGNPCQIIKENDKWQI